MFDFRLERDKLDSVFVVRQMHEHFGQEERVVACFFVNLGELSMGFRWKKFGEHEGMLVLRSRHWGMLVLRSGLLVIDNMCGGVAGALELEGCEGR